MSGKSTSSDRETRKHIKEAKAPKNIRNTRRISIKA